MRAMSSTSGRPGCSEIMILCNTTLCKLCGSCVLTVSIAFETHIELPQKLVNDQIN